MKNTGRRPLNIVVAVERSVKAQRDKLSGVLRYAAAKPNWNLVIAERNAKPPFTPDGQIFIHLPHAWYCNAKIPSIIVDRPHLQQLPWPHVVIDNYAIGESAAEFFLRRGLANLAAIRYPLHPDIIHSERRIEGFAAVAAKAGITPHVFTPASATENSFLCNSESFRQWLRALPKPCGIFCYWDQHSRDTLDTCRLTRISIPDQISILGVDNEIEVCEMTRPTLSSIQPDFEAGGYLAAKVLDRLLSHRKVERKHSYGILRLVERDSTRSMNAGGRIVSAAIKLMRSKSAKISVRELAHELHVSPTLLNIRFREILGHGPKEEIDRLRLEEIKELLRDPSLSVTEISERCNFAYPENLHLFFRRHTGLTPTEWRKQGVMN